MSTPFNPYHKWLGISPKEQPANHYRLLGLSLFESDPDVIDAAADQRMGHLRTYQSGPHAQLSQRLLGEVARARICLLNERLKAAYDATLRQSTAVAPAQMPHGSPVFSRAAPPTTLPPVAAARPAGLPPVAAVPPVGAVPPAQPLPTASLPYPPASGMKPAESKGPVESIHVDTGVPHISTPHEGRAARHAVASRKSTDQPWWLFAAAGGTAALLFAVVVVLWIGVGANSATAQLVLDWPEEDRPGATLLLNDQKHSLAGEGVQVTPTSVAIAMKPGTHRVEVKWRGEADCFEQECHLTAGQELRLSVQRQIPTSEPPESGSGRLIVVAPAEQRTYLAIQLLDSELEPLDMTTLLELRNANELLYDLAPGAYVVQATRPGYERFEQMVNLAAGDSLTLVPRWVQTSVIAPLEVVENGVPEQEPQPMENTPAMPASGVLSLTDLKPISVKATNGDPLINRRLNNSAPPLVKGAACTEFILSQGSCTAEFLVPPDCQWFATFAVSSGPQSVIFIIAPDGKVSYSSANQNGETPIVVKLPPDAKTLHLATYGRTVQQSPYGYWCYPRFYTNEPRENWHLTPNGATPQPPGNIGLAELLANGPRAVKQEMPPEIRELKYFEGRDLKHREQLLSLYGGNIASEAALMKGLNWLAQVQRSDGRWSFDTSYGGNGTGGGSKANAPNGATGLALLAFLGAGCTHTDGIFKDTVNKGMFFLAGNGAVGSGGISFHDPDGNMYSHALATAALCEMYGMTKDAKLYKPMRGAIAFTLYAQDPKGGGWRYTPRQSGDSSVTGWQIASLRAFSETTDKVPELRLVTVSGAGANAFLNSVQSRGGAAYGYDTTKVELSTTAVGLATRVNLGWQRNNPALREGVEILDRAGPDWENLYFTYYATQVMRFYGGPEWERWNERMRDPLIQLQANSPGGTGSWYFGTDQLGVKEGGRLYCTAMAALLLESYYRYMPPLD